MPVKKLPLEDQDDQDANGDRRIGQVENGPEENELFSGAEREPLRDMTLYYREIKHVHHLAIKQRGVAALLGEHPGHGKIRAFVEYPSVKDAVDDVARSACHDEGHTED